MKLNNKKGVASGVELLGIFWATVLVASIAGSPFICDSNGKASDEGLLGKRCLIGEGGKYAVTDKAPSNVEQLLGKEWKI